MDVKRLYQIGKTNGACTEARAWLYSQGPSVDIKTLPITVNEIRWIRWLTYKFACPIELDNAIYGFYMHVYAMRDQNFLARNEELTALEYSDDTAYWNRIEAIERQWIVDMQPEVDRFVEAHRDAFVAWLETLS